MSDRLLTGKLALLTIVFMALCVAAALPALIQGVFLPGTPNRARPYHCINTRGYSAMLLSCTALSLTVPALTAAMGITPNGGT